MQRIPTLLQKIQELAQKNEPNIIEVDLMMDYTRVMYADLVEWRNRMVFTTSLVPETAPLPQQQQQQISQPAEPQTPSAGEKKEPTPLPPIQPAMISPEAPVAESQTQYLATGVDFRQMIGINDKYQFVSELFGNNKDAYDSVVEEINGFETYDQARHWLESYMADIYNWEEDHETVQSFYGLVSSFFASR